MLQSLARRISLVRQQSSRISRYQGRRMDYALDPESIQKDSDEVKQMNMVNYYRSKGHHFTQLDPLEMLVK